MSTSGGFAGHAPANPAGPDDALRPVSPGVLGFSALEAAVMEVVWAAGGELSTGEISRHLEHRRPVACSTVEAVVTALVRKGHLQRSSRGGTWYYQAARSLAGHLGQLIGSLLRRSPDPVATLALAGAADAPASDGGQPAVRVAVCYDGCWYQNAARFFTHERGAVISMAGLHDAIRWHAAGLFSCPVQRVAISGAHYVAGRTELSSWYKDDLADHGIICHDVPVTAGKGEVGADVELALTCYQLACETSPDMIALLAGDGDFAPLAARLTGRGIRVLVPTANFSYPRSGDGTMATVTTSAWLARRATDTPALAGLLDATGSESYPPFLIRPFPATATSRTGQPGRRHGTVTTWLPGARYGFVSADDGLTWFAPVLETPRHTPLPPGCPVTFTGDPSPPPGKKYPPARAILPLTTGHDQEAVNAAREKLA